MYRLLVEESKFEDLYDDVRQIANKKGFITIEEFKNTMRSLRSITTNDRYTGWPKNIINLGVSGIEKDDDTPEGYIFIVLLDPVDIPKQCKKSPDHYADGRKYEPRKVIYDWGLDFNLGNAVKYISRAVGKNDKIEDLKKAIEYIKFEIEEEENKNEK